MIYQLQSEDELVKKKRASWDKNPSTDHAWSFDEDGILRHNSVLYIPESPALRQGILQRCHDDPLAGHFGVERTRELISRKYFWPKLTDDIAAYIRTCDICQRTRVHRHKPYGELQSLPEPLGPWQELSMDFIVKLPPSKNGEVYNSILMIVDRYTKLAKYFPVVEKITANQLAELFSEKIVSVYGTPKGIVSNRGSLFISSF